MNPYHFSNLFSPQNYPSLYTPNFIRFATLLQGINFLEKDFRLLELCTEENEWIKIHQTTLVQYEYKLLDDFLTSSTSLHEKNIYDLIIINADWARIEKEKQDSIFNSCNTLLKTSGAICFRYSLMPGCVPLLALRDLMLIQINPSVSGEERKMQGLQSLYFTDNYANTNSLFFQRVPKAKECLEDIKRTPFEQLEKDWLDPNWKPIFSSDLSEKLEKENYQFLTSLIFPLQLDMCLPDDVAKMMQGESDIILRETIRDFGLNQLARVDLYSRNLSLQDGEEIEHEISNIPFCLTAPRRVISSIQIPTPNGDIVFDDDLYFAFLDALADENYKPKTIHELKQHQKLQEIDPSLFLAIINILVASGHIYPVSPILNQEIENKCTSYNLAIVEAIQHQNISPVLASPVLGSGFPLSRIALLLLLGYLKGEKSEEKCAQFVLDLLKSKNENLLDQEGKVMNDESSLTLLKNQAAIFINLYLPYLIAIKAFPIHSSN